MPQNKKNSTLLRQWEMMRNLTVSRSDRQQGGRWDKVSAITDRLNNSGYEVSRRTVQRDLHELREIFPIELNDKNPRDYGWRWMKDANLNIPGISASEALAMRLVEMHLKQLMPDTMLEGLQGIFSLARTKLDEIAKNNSGQVKDWLDKVRVVPPSQPLLAPRVNEEIQANIYQALLENRQITASYQPMGHEQPKDYLLHPLGIIMRGSVSYLVASARNYDEARLYALHRFKSVEMLDAVAKTPDGFSLDSAIAGGLADFASQGGGLRLEIRCTEAVAAYLAETPLAVDQEISKESDGWSRVTATVNDTWQLRWWLLAQGAGVEVCAPISLREETKNVLSDALVLYERR